MTNSRGAPRPHDRQSILPVFANSCYRLCLAAFALPLGGELHALARRQATFSTTSRRPSPNCAQLRRLAVSGRPGMHWQCRGSDQSSERIVLCEQLIQGFSCPAYAESPWNTIARILVSRNHPSPHPQVFQHSRPGYHNRVATRAWDLQPITAPGARRLGFTKEAWTSHNH